MSSNENRDVLISIPVATGKSCEPECRAPRDVPWGAPLSRETAASRAGVTRQLLDRVAALLEAAQAAHRAGHLSEDGLDQLDALQRWYSSLHAEHVHLQQLAQAPDKQ